MDRSQVVSGLKQLLVPYIGVEKSKLENAKEEADLTNDLGVKSTDVINIVLDIEKKWDIAFKDEEIDSLSTVSIKSIVDLILSKKS